VRSGDVIVADVNGVVVIPVEKLDAVLAAAGEILAKEEAMLSALRAGESILEVDKRFGYETMLQSTTHGNPT
jgi:regulator of RNase E activity RraA